jgi:hypothetical protein
VHRRRERVVDQIDVRIGEQRFVGVVGALDDDREATAPTLTSSRRRTGQMIALTAMPAAPRIPIVLMRLILS